MRFQTLKTLSINEATSVLQNTHPDGEAEHAAREAEGGSRGDRGQPLEHLVVQKAQLQQEHGQVVQLFRVLRGLRGGEQNQ